ncbi:carboxymuconolactone decarboxylase family protein [Sphaerisporangium fuscum]|uniref:carboxymuconolactone decarboxylase family protein n=1 Tax=Sphaerisporangium fuscum TaxID=2835868 RepID=UPI0020299E3B|nr:carboxymuconolactone decarboxylase family protein [Sphaerisporangium fuscum]
MNEVTPEVSGAMGALEAAATAAAQDAGLEPELLELLKIRASQINGCELSLELHTRDARLLGETEERLQALRTWRTSTLFGDRERAALALTESITLVHAGQVPNSLYQAAAAVFEEAQMAALIWTVTVINATNRVAVATRMTPSTSPQTLKAG